ncbi:hypothetical protein ABPG72_017092 [Tetrahymena utriculariae]
MLSNPLTFKQGMCLLILYYVKNEELQQLFNTSYYLLQNMCFLAKIPFSQVDNLNYLKLKVIEYSPCPMPDLYDFLTKERPEVVQIDKHLEENSRTLFIIILIRKHFLRTTKCISITRGKTDETREALKLIKTRKQIMEEWKQKKQQQQQQLPHQLELINSINTNQNNQLLHESYYKQQQQQYLIINSYLEKNQFPTQEENQLLQINQTNSTNQQKDTQKLESIQTFSNNNQVLIIQSQTKLDVSLEHQTNEEDYPTSNQSIANQEQLLYNYNQIQMNDSIISNNNQPDQTNMQKEYTTYQQQEIITHPESLIKELLTKIILSNNNYQSGLQENLYQAQLNEISKQKDDNNLFPDSNIRPKNYDQRINDNNYFGQNNYQNASQESIYQIEIDENSNRRNDQYKEKEKQQQKQMNNKLGNINSFTQQLPQTNQYFHLFPHESILSQKEFQPLQSVNQEYLPDKKRIKLLDLKLKENQRIWSIFTPLQESTIFTNVHPFALLKNKFKEYTNTQSLSILFTVLESHLYHQILKEYEDLVRKLLDKLNNLKRILGATKLKRRSMTRIIMRIALEEDLKPLYNSETLLDFYLENRYTDYTKDFKKAVNYKRTNN